MSASRKQGMVSNASRSAPDRASTSNLGRWKSRSWASILGAVGQHGSEGPDRGRDQGTQASFAVGGHGPEFLSGFHRQPDGTPHQLRSRVAIHPAALKPLERGLIGRRRSHIGADLEIVEMHGADQPGLFDQGFRRP